MTEKPKVIIVGAGPAGLTAAIELLKHGQYQPIVVEELGSVGGIARTISHNGNRMDIGGHRFFTRDPRVSQFWNSRFPRAGAPACDNTWQDSLPLAPGGPDPETTERVMLVRRRLSRILFNGTLIDYPINLNKAFLRGLGGFPFSAILLNYFHAKLFPLKNEDNLEAFLINRFGRKLYSIFFHDYVIKVWGQHPSQINSEWGYQRIKSLGFTELVKDAYKALSQTIDPWRSRSSSPSLIRYFEYPKYGPGQFWEAVAEEVIMRGGKILTGWKVSSIETSGQRVVTATLRESAGNSEQNIPTHAIFSSMPIKALMEALRPQSPQDLVDIAKELPCRGFMSVGLLISNLNVNREKINLLPGKLIPDNWIYVQDSKVGVGRIQIYNNWSPYLLADRSKVWLGMEYFCQEGDALWNNTDSQLVEIAFRELALLGLATPESLLDATVARVPCAYPAYWGSYKSFEKIKVYLDSMQNLYPIGRNGMHRYNNMDHAMLTAMESVDCLIQNREKSSVWKINEQKVYGE